MQPFWISTILGHHTMYLVRANIFFFVLILLCPCAYATDWWLLSYTDLICIKPIVVSEKMYTPEMIMKEYSGCFVEQFDEGKGIYLNCDSSSLKSNFIFTSTLESCKNWAEKIRQLRDQGKDVPKK
jgi:hypothetical protein